MPYTRRIMCAAAVCIALISVMFPPAASAQPRISVQDQPMTIPGILKTSGCPLNHEQSELYDAIGPNHGADGIEHALNELFTADQKTALRSRIGEDRLVNRRSERPGRIRNLYEMFILEKEGAPMTFRQLSMLRSLTSGGPAVEWIIRETFTPPQLAIIGRYRD